MNDLRYPIGTYEAPDHITPEQIDSWIQDIEELPQAVGAVVSTLSDQQLETPYRPEGWTVRQVVHHLADSHMNSVIRFKWALTESTPTIKTYFEERWAELPDSQNFPIDDALRFLELLHARWSCLLRGLTAEQLKRELVHPDTGAITLAANIGLYAWHGRHHLAHITALGTREGW